MESLSVGLLAYAWYKAYLSYLSVKGFKFISLYKSLPILPILVKAFEFLSLSSSIVQTIVRSLTNQ
jgi:hypothetical protein